MWYTDNYHIPCSLTIGGKHAKNTLRTDCAVDDAVIGEFCLSTGKHRHRFTQREHRDQYADVPGTRPGTGLPGLLRSTGGCKLLLLRWHVLGLPER